MSLSVHFIRVFLGASCQGNTAAVVLSDNPLASEYMQSLAGTYPVAATAFVVKTLPTEESDYFIRWFSSREEISLCGHATLASAHVLFSQLPERQHVLFSTKVSGNIDVHRVACNALEGRITNYKKNLQQKPERGQAVSHQAMMVEMCLPNKMPEEVDIVPTALLSGLSIEPVAIYQNKEAYFVLYRDEQDIQDVKVSIDTFKELMPRAVAISASSEHYDFVSRYFWPTIVGGEDAVTGSSHAGLAPLWADKLGHSELIAYQASAQGGVLYCKVDTRQVWVGGQTVGFAL